MRACVCVIICSLEETMVYAIMPDALVTYDGIVTLNYQTLNRISCSFNVAEFPFDRQRCQELYQIVNYQESEIQMFPGTYHIENGNSAGVFMCVCLCVCVC
jgi:hypothetical protein